MLYTGYCYDKGPTAVRFPRGCATGTEQVEEMTVMTIGKGLLKRQGEKIAILNFGTTLAASMTVAENLNASLADMRFVKPLDEELVKKLAESHDILVTVEENTIMGGAGSGVLELLQKLKLPKRVLQIGIPDQFIKHGSPEEVLADIQLDANGIQQQIEEYTRDL